MRYAAVVHSFACKATYCVTGQVRQLEEAERLAVEQEDFESAANLSTELDALRSVYFSVIVCALSAFVH